MEKEVKQVIQRRTGHYRSLLHQMVNGFALFEITANRRSGACDCRLLEVNATFESITGLKAKEVVGCTLCELAPEIDSGWVDKCAEVLSTARSMQFKTHFKNCDKELEIRAFSPCEGRLAVVLTDASAGMCLEQALRSSESNFRAIAENSHDGIVVTDSIKGPLVYANQRACEITGFATQELLQIGPPQLVLVQEYPLIKRIVERRLLGRNLPDCCEAQILRKDGVCVTVEVCGSSTVWQGKAAAMLFLRDISLRKVIEDKISKINRELERRVNERTRELTETAAKLEWRQREILKHKADLERVNKELVQTNSALSVLARNMDRKCEKLEIKIAQKVSGQMIPLIDDIDRDGLPGKSRSKLEVLAAYLKNLTPGAAKSREVIVSLSGMELQVAMMIKNGFRTDEIARILSISPHTVKTHRRSIRKKLGIRNSQVNLSSYLKYKLGRSFADRQSQPIDIHDNPTINR